MVCVRDINAISPPLIIQTEDIVEAIRIHDHAGVGSERPAYSERSANGGESRCRVVWRGFVVIHCHVDFDFHSAVAGI